MVPRSGPVGRGIGRGAGDVGSRSRGRDIWGRSGDVGGRGRDVGSRCWGIGGLCVGWIGGLSSVDHISNIAAVGISHLVVDGLEAAIREGHRVGAGSGVAVSLLTCIDLDAVIVVYTIVVGIDGWLVIGWLLVGVGGSRSVGGSSRGVAVVRHIISSSQSGEGENNDDLQSQ
jgi:hypothetical protein